MRTKKILSAALAAALALGQLTGCASAAAQVGTPAASPAASAPAAQAKTYTVGILQQVEHTSLDEIRTAVEARLSELAAQNGTTVRVEYKNAQGDAATMKAIAGQFVSEGVDAIIPIATGAAQAAAGTTQSVPIVFSAVADPVAAGLVTSFDSTPSNVTGVSNGIDVGKIFELAAQLTPSVKRYGFVYNAGEVNSQSLVGKAKAYLDAHGMRYEEVTVTSSAEVQQAAKAIVAKGVDAFFIPNDNTVASALPVLAQEALAAHMPVYTTADSMVRDGGLATVGINYTQLGRQTADMVYKVLTGTPISGIPVELVSDSAVVVNRETAAALGVDVSKYTA